MTVHQIAAGLAVAFGLASFMHYVLYRRWYPSEPVVNRHRSDAPIRLMLIATFGSALIVAGAAAVIYAISRWNTGTFWDELGFLGGALVFVGVAVIIDKAWKPYKLQGELNDVFERVRTTT